MKKIISLVLAASLLILFGCAKSGSTTTDTTTPIITGQDVPERQTYESKADGFSIQYPGTRTFREKAFGSSVIFFTPVTEGDKITENVGIMTGVLDKEYTIDEYYEIMKPKLISLISNFTEVSNENIQINDIPAKKLVYKGIQAENNIQRKQIYLIKNNVIYTITYTATEATFNEFAEKIDEIAATLEIK